ncbi:MAG TPA: hypothetical protein VNL77_19765 [Roseiflexaceae bacterium]|nr:hypothetical protein [Roseiflexaceae bacterium]
MKKIDYAVAASAVFIHHLHRDGFDRGMIATFGSSLHVNQNFTSSSAHLYTALRSVRLNGATRLYDSIEDVVQLFWRYGDRQRPWLLTIITDGQDNESRKYKNRPANIGQYVATNFMHEPTNFTFLIGVGSGQEIDATALATLGKMGRFPAMTIAAFPLLERLFLQIALSISEQLIGQQINIGNLTWEQVSRIYQVSQIPIDYAFLIDCSTSMESAG